MLRKRLIFTLIYCDDYFMLSRNFNLQKVGNIEWLEKNYNFQKISFSLDELIILDCSRNIKHKERFANTVKRVVNNVFMPVSAGGGISNIDDAKLLFESGADKIVLNTLLYQSPDTVLQLISIYGAQAIIASIDYKINDNSVYISDGNLKIPLSLDEYIRLIEDLGVGEIYLNSIDRDGTGFGYDFTTIKRIAASCKIPLIIAGGAGNEKHFIEGLKINDVNAVATANLFNFIGSGLPNARKQILAENINLARWL